MSTRQLNIRFYQNISKLFYAIAASDNNVRPEEFNTLKNIVKKEWLTVDDTEDLFHTDTAYQIEIVFDWLNSKNMDADSCYKEFIEYKKEHDYFFTKEIKALVLKTAGVIAASFSGVNKSELIMLANLSIEFKKQT